MKKNLSLHLPSKRVQHGFTLLEVLIAVLLLALGAVSILGLQVASIKMGGDAKYQSTALQLASDLSAMMRSNPTVASINNNSQNPYLINKSSAPASVSAGSGLSSHDSVASIASADVEQWYARLYEALPGARVTVCFDASPYDSQGLPQWSCSNSGTTPYIKIGWTLRESRAGLDKGIPGIVVPVGVCNPLNANATAACVGGLAP